MTRVLMVSERAWMLVLLTGLSLGRTAATADKPASGGKAASAAAEWDRQAAARYMDSREVWWQGWDHARRDHGTRCVSCHTQAPYALARPELRGDLGESAPTDSEELMLADVEKRVRAWDTMLPFYSDELYGTGKEIQSRNAESVLNAVILSSYDRKRGHMSDLTRTAFDHAWALQSQTGADAGAWVWQNFDYAPWESKESQYHWAALMAVSVRKAPDRYRDDPRIAGNLAKLRGYLRSHLEGQPLVNQITALWAEATGPSLLTKEQRSKLAADIISRERSDGGWSLTDLGTWKRRDDTPLESRSDGYATGLIVLVFDELGLGTRQADAGAKWLIANQNRTTGAWPAWSLNKNRDLKSEVGQFMSDAATGYAVMALEARMQPKLH